MEIGKVSNNDLEKYVFKNINSHRKEVLTKSSIGIDTAVLDFDGDLIVTSVDPITGANKNLGYLAINISVNDVSCQGADPVGVLISILLPAESKLEDLNKIMEDADRACRQNNLEIIGGHTEVTDAVNKIVLTTTVIARVNKNKMPDISSIKVGDVIAVSKDIGLEGTSIILEEKGNEFLSEDELIKESIDIKDLSVLREAKIAVDFNVKYMHDVTEGGIYGALWECSEAIGKGIEVDNIKIPVKDVTKKIGSHYNINIYGLISSGSMLMVFNEEDFKAYKKACLEKNIKITQIGEVTEENKKILIDNGKKIEIPEPASDELYKII
ncbi:hydrogenase maturation protein [Peptoniphilus lacrimalis DNF00528]|nr:hydrogenase maturation protein [Peptoniphilus lacrimalis DNF00528]